MLAKRRTRLRQTILGHLAEVRRELALSALCMLGFTAAELAWPWPLKLVFDHVLLGRPGDGAVGQALGPALTWSPGALLGALCGVMLALALARAGFAYAQVFITTRIGFRLVSRLRRDLFWQLQRLSLGFHSRARSGELLTKVTSDTHVLRDVFADWALMLAAHLLTVGGMIVVMVVVSPSLALAVVGTIPVLALVLARQFRRTKKSARAQRKKEGAVAARLGELLTSVPLVQAFGRERFEQARFDAQNEEVLAESIRSARLDAAATRGVELVGALGTIVVVLLGSREVLAGRMAPGDVLVFLGYAASLYRPMRNIAKLSTKLSRASVSAERISEILELEPEISDRPGAIRAAGLRGRVSARGVSFRYGDGADVLRDVSFEIAPGQRVALVGGSGAGKSTLLHLLLRLYDPRGGSIAIDGVDVRDYQRESLRGEIGIVLQDALLLGATVRENVAYGRPDATQAEIEAAARQAHAHEFIQALPRGYDTVLGERGATLSGGQRQRLSLARALVKRPSILILDEPTAAVDAESERKILQAIERLQGDRTVIVIAHRLSFIRGSDLILMLEGGRIVEQGRHEQLMALRGAYWRLVAAQADAALTA